MTLEKLQSEMIQAMKNKDKLRKSVLSGLVDAVKKASMTNSGRVEITEQLVDEVLLKYKKMVQEQIDTCPAGRIETLEEYKAQMAIVVEFAPTLIADETEIRNLIFDIVNNEMEFSKANRGKIMKIVAPVLKGKADMSIVNKVLGNMLTEDTK
jgi:uncharacterized protein YqeY